MYMYIVLVRVGGSKAVCCICHTAQLRGDVHHTAQHVITVRVLAFLTREPEPEARVVRYNGTLDTVSIDHYCMYNTRLRTLTITYCVC